MAEWRRIARSADEMEAAGAALADAMPPVTRGPAVVYLSGDLGAGKTTLARGFLRRRGLIEPARSPTFALLECYELADIVVVHVDLYRLREPLELDALGLRDLARPGHAWLVEWPERGAGWLPVPDVHIDLYAASPEAHAISAASHSPLGAAWLERVVEFSPPPT